MDIINVRLPAKKKEQVRKMIRDLPRILSGKKNDIYGVRKAFYGGLAHELFAIISQNYFRKAQLFEDELGDGWQDISERTKAYRRAKVRKHRLSLLSSRERKEWWKIYKQWKAIFYRMKIPESQIKSQAAKKAWTEIKKQGGRTKIDVYGKKKFLVMIDKGKLLESLVPGSFNGTQYRTRNRNQVFKIYRNRLEMGTRIKYASRHHTPKEPNFPQRRLWPKKITPWVRRAAGEGLLAAARKLAGNL